MKKYLVLGIVGSMIYALGLAQVPVSKEPRHHKLLDNDHVRLLDVHIPPGDTSQMHIHATPSVFVMLSTAKAGSQVMSEEDRSKYPVQHFDNIYFEGFYKQARIHRVWNSDNIEFHVMDIELPNRNFIELDPPLHQKGVSFLFEEKPVRAYRVVLTPGTNISIAARKADVLLIRLTDDSGAVRARWNAADSRTSDEKIFWKRGDFLYLTSLTGFNLINQGNSKKEFAFFELK